MATGIVDYPETLKLLEDLLKDKPVDIKKSVFQDNVIEFYKLHDVVQLWIPYFLSAAIVLHHDVENMNILVVYSIDFCVNYSDQKLPKNVL